MAGMMIDQTDNGVIAAHIARGGGAAIVGLVVAAIVFLALLLVFGEEMFGDMPTDNNHAMSKVEVPVK